MKKYPLTVEQMGLYAVAVHELSHAIVGAMVGFSIKSVKVKYSKSCRSGVVTPHKIPKHLKFHSILFTMAGPVGEWVFADSCDDYAIKRQISSIPLYIKEHKAYPRSDWTKLSKCGTPKQLGVLMREMFGFLNRPSVARIVEALVPELVQTGELSARSLRRLHVAAKKLRAPKTWCVPHARKKHGQFQTSA